MKNVFFSKSRQKSKLVADKVQMVAPREVLTDRAFYIANPIIWLGKDLNAFFTHGLAFNFNCLWLDNKDLSSLIHAKCLVFSYVDMFGKTIRVLNFAREYGIPTLWLHRYAPPETAFWNFDVMTNEKNYKTFWEVVCNLAT